MDEQRYREAERALWVAQGVTPTERRVRLSRAGAMVRVQEVGEGPPVLFVHGGPNSGSTWAPMIGGMAGSRYRCLIVDRPGTGLSEPMRGGGPTPASLPGYADNAVAEQLDALEIERAHVVASSFGGYLALRSAAAHPERIDRMVQMGCPAFVPGMRTPAFMRMLMVGAARRMMNVFPPNPRVGRMMMKQVGHGESMKAGLIPEVVHDWSFALQRDTDTMKNDGEMIGRMGSLRGLDPTLMLDDGVLGAVRAPTLFIWGDNDPFGS